MKLPVQDASPGDAVGDKRHTDDIAPASKFELERHIEVAVKMLSLDPNLAKIHARLISKMPEETFWCHYFSRVAAIRTEVGLEPLCDDLHPVRVPLKRAFHATSVRAAKLPQPRSAPRFWYPRGLCLAQSSRHVRVRFAGEKVHQPTSCFVFFRTQLMFGCVPPEYTLQRTHPSE